MVDSMTSLPMSTEEVPATSISPFGLDGFSGDGAGECSTGSSFDSAVSSAGLGLDGGGLGGLAELFGLVMDAAFPDSLKILDTSDITRHQQQEQENGDQSTYPLERFQNSSTRIFFGGLSGASTCRGVASIGPLVTGAAEEPESSSSSCSSETWLHWLASPSSASSSLMLV